MNLRRAAFWSLLDQLLLSGGHFALGLLVLRLSTKVEYGTYVLGWSVLLLLTGLQNAFITSQMTVRAAALPATEQRDTCAAFLLVQCTLYAAILSVVLCASLLVWMTLPAYGTHATFAAVVSIACGGTALREFSRSVLLLRMDARRVLKIDVSYLLALAAILLVVLRTPLTVPWPFVAIAAMGIGSAIASLPCVRDLWPHRSSVHASWTLFRSTATNGLWAVGGVGVTHIQSQSYVYLLGALSGLAATAEANAARLLLMPMSLAFTSLQRVIYPHWVGLARNAKQEDLSAAGGRIFALTTAGVAIYALVVETLSSTIADALFGPSYHATSGFISAFALLTWAEAARSIVSLQLQAHARFKVITLCNTVTAVAVVCVAVVTIPAAGALGAVIVQASGDLLLAVMLLYMLHRPRSPRLVSA